MIYFAIYFIHATNWFGKPIVVVYNKKSLYKL